MEEIHLKDIAEAASVSVGECCRCFQNMVRTTPNQYLMEYWIEKSKELLMGTEMSVTEVAYAAGFSDSSYFIQCFRKYEGLHLENIENVKIFIWNVNKFMVLRRMDC